MKLNLETLGLVLTLSVISFGINAQTLPGGVIHSGDISEGISAPSRIAVAPSGKMYVTDAFNKTIAEYDESGNFTRDITIDGVPISVAVNSQNELFIGDGFSGDILKYNGGSTNIFYSGSEYPTSMVFSPDDFLFVTDLKQSSVLQIDISGNLVKTITYYDMMEPTGIAYDNANSHLIVGEHGGKGWGFSPTVKVWIFNLDGTFAGSFGRHGNIDGRFYRIQGVTTGNCGNIYVVDPYLARISVFSENGSFITKFGIWGDQEGQLNVPMDIAFNNKGQIVVSSMNNGKLKLFNLVGSLPTATIKSGNEMICSGSSTDVEVEFTGIAPWTFEYTLDGLNPSSITTSDNPYYLNVTLDGLYEITSLQDGLLRNGTCFTGAANISVGTEEPGVITSGGTVLCEGETAEISLAFTGVPPWTFTYSRDGFVQETISTTNNLYPLEVSEGGVYQLTELYGGGCPASDLGDPVEIIHKPLPTAEITQGNGHVPLGSNLTIVLTGTPPWTITYTVDDLNPVTIDGILSSPYSLTTTEPGTYEVKLVSDVYCSNNRTTGFPEAIIFPNPVSEDDYAMVSDGETVIIDVLANDNGDIDPASLLIVGPPATGLAVTNPDGTISYTPGEESCMEESLTYQVFSYSGLPGNIAGVFITIVDITPPVFSEEPLDITVNCGNIPEPPAISATDNCDPEVQAVYLGETRDNFCVNGYYSLTRTWYTSDINGNENTYTQEITVTSAFTTGCFTVQLGGIEYNSSENITSYYWELSASGCAKELGYIVFEMPEGIVATEPMNRSTYIYPGNQYEYQIHNPSWSIKQQSYGIKFLPKTKEILTGGPEIFVYSLPGNLVMENINVCIKSGKPIYKLTIPTKDCICSGNYLVKTADIAHGGTDSGDIQLNVFPNPFREQLFFEIKAPDDTYARLEIISITGARLATILDQDIKGGVLYRLEYDPGDIAEGMIFYKMIIAGRIKSGKVIFDSGR